MDAADEISWPTLKRIVRDWAGEEAQLARSMPLVGGCINTTLLLTTMDERRAVVKITPYRVNRTFEVEAFQLQRLRDAGVPVPEVYIVHSATLENPHSYILMEYVEGSTLCDAHMRAGHDGFEALQLELAGILARLHEVTDTQYGKIGQIETSTANWASFYGTIYEPTMTAVRQAKEIPLKVRKKLNKVHESLGHLLEHSDCPRLLHGDLWGGNVLCHQRGGAWKIAALIDPSLRFGHFESELAYIDLFDTCGAPFRREYQKTHRLDDGYHRIRKSIYQLYPLMHHVELFGQKYVPHLLRVAEQVRDF